MGLWVGRHITYGEDETNLRSPLFSSCVYRTQGNFDVKKIWRIGLIRQI